VLPGIFREAVRSIKIKATIQPQRVQDSNQESKK
jgi:hypothetical protein